jgi:hypothetical protein
MAGVENAARDEIFSKAVRAGKRTYFFDVKATRRNDYYLTITESKKRFNRDGRFFYEKHKIFLYKEDFDKFIEGLSSSVDFIKTNAPEQTVDRDVEDDQDLYQREEVGELVSDNYTDVDFDDLDKKEK